MAVKPHMDRVFALTLLAGSGLSFTQEPVCANETSTFWYDGDRARLIYPTRDQRVFFTITKNNQKNQIDRDLFTQNNPDHTILNETEYSIRYRSSNIQTEPATVTPPIDLYGHPVFHQSIDSEEDLLLSTGQIIVHFREPTPKDKAQNWGETHILELEQPLTTPNTFLFRCPSQDGCIEAANQSYADPKVRFAYPNWLRPRISRDLAVNLGNDTYFSYLCHLENFGQTGGIPREDIHAQSAWQNNHSSSNTVIGVVDDGLEIAHEDIIENNQATLNWDFLSNDSDPTGGTHGTAVAGLAAARGGNNIGISGVAPHAAIAGIRLIGATTDTNETAALTLHKDAIDIYNNSWGPHDLGNLDGPAPLTQAALLDGVTYGRNGLGAIYVWAAGNGRVTNDNANYDGYANNPYTIAVSATNSHGKLTYYSEPGACILVNAPGGDYTSWMATTDRTGLAGYNVGNYTFNFGGTSASVPVVSGVIALMLDANPNLSWRDIKQILAETE
jgi:kexin